VTPLAHSIAKQLTLPVKRRTFVSDPPGILSKICDAHCFETTEVLPLAKGLFSSREAGSEGSYDGRKIQFMGPKVISKFAAVAERVAFLPAPVTWIEFKDPTLPRDGFLLVDDQYGRGDWITALRCDEQGCNFGFSFPKGGKPFDAVMHGEGDMTEEENTGLSVFVTMVISLLAIINTPKIVGRRTHLPHAGLQKRLARAYQMPGKYPLHAWHEVRLHVNVPLECRDTEEAYLTGMRALHFCRSYLRIRQGQLELVSWHWRGNPALGMKQTRYRVTP
jgi:hypothetical protein